MANGGWNGDVRQLVGYIKSATQIRGVKEIRRALAKIASQFRKRIVSGVYRPHELIESFNERTRRGSDLVEVLQGQVSNRPDLAEVRTLVCCNHDSPQSLPVALGGVSLRYVVARDGVNSSPGANTYPRLASWKRMPRSCRW